MWWGRPAANFSARHFQHDQLHNGQQRLVCGQRPIDPECLRSTRVCSDHLRQYRRHADLLPWFILRMELAACIRRHCNLYGHSRHIRENRFGQQKLVV